MAAGYRSLEAAWIGGASAPSVIPVAGYTSLLAFWVGGASGFTESVVPPIPVGIPDSGGYVVRTQGNQAVYQDLRKYRREQELREQIIREDEEIMAIIIAIGKYFQ